MKPGLSGLVVGMRDAAKASIPALGHMQPPFLWISGALPPSVKGQRRDADHSFLSIAEVNNTKALPPLPIRIDRVVLD
jgi:hypothetical protein